MSEQSGQRKKPSKLGATAFVVLVVFLFFFGFLGVGSLFLFCFQAFGLLAVPRGVIAHFTWCFDCCWSFFFVYRLLLVCKTLPPLPQRPPMYNPQLRTAVYNYRRARSVPSVVNDSSFA